MKLLRTSMVSNPYAPDRADEVPHMISTDRVQGSRQDEKCERCRVQLMLYMRRRMFEKGWQTSRDSQDAGSDVTPRARWMCLRVDDWRTSHVRLSVTSARDLWLLYS